VRGRCCLVRGGAGDNQNPAVRPRQPAGLSQRRYQQAPA